MPANWVGEDVFPGIPCVPFLCLTATIRQPSTSIFRSLGGLIGAASELLKVDES